jgi:phosphoserine aminotransferase
MNTAAAVHRVFNFSPGPAVLPLPVLEQVRDEMLSLRGSGISILEISHRDDLFLQILAEAKNRLRQLFAIPDNYRILFLQGGSRLQFSMVPMNLAPNRDCQYLLTGSWGKYAMAEAVKCARPTAAWDGKPDNYSSLPQPADWRVNPQAAYVHYTSNETIQGVQFASEPEAADVPLVCDASSDFLSRPLPIAKYGLIYACAQKNAGPAGVTVVIIRDDLLQRSNDDLPSYLNYRTQAENDSLFNTAPTFGIYVVNLVGQWLADEIGGLQKMKSLKQGKCQLLYQVIDESGGFYQGHAAPHCRSMMNVTFRLPSDELQNAFLREAERREMVALQGHRSVGGIRASIYNAMPLEGVERLRDHMLDFQRRHGT